MELYKYCKSVHAEQALQFGGVRIGTLSDYRRTDTYGEFVSDSMEGSKLLGGSALELTSENIQKYPGLGGIMGLERGASIQYFSFSHNTVISPDYLVFSASHEYSEASHRKWLEGEGYDACYRIISARLFFRGLARQLQPTYRLLGFGRVVYASHLEISDPRSDLNPALIKRQTAHIDQAEVRAFWARNDGGPLEPVVLERTRVSLYLRPHAILE